MNILSSDKNFKAILCGFIGMAIDKLIYKSPNIKNTLILGSCLAGSNYIASSLQENNMIPTISSIETYNSETIHIKTIEQRIIELCLSTGSSYAVNTIVLKNMRPNLPIQDILFIFGGSSVISEYITDYMFNQKLSYLVFYILFIIIFNFINRYF